MFMALAYGAMTGVDLLCDTAYAASKPKPGNSGPDDVDDGSGTDSGGNGGPDDTNDDGGCGSGGGSDSGGGADPDGSGGGTDF